MRSLLLVLVVGVHHSYADEGPGGRDAHQMMTYDERAGRVLLFGGSGQDRTLGGLWAWDGQNWTQLSDGGPQPRNAGIMVYDSQRNRTVLFGGRDAASQQLGDTWEWDGQRWRLVHSNGPAPRIHSAAAFDRKRGVLVLFGPVFAPKMMPRPLPAETWTWNGRTWTKFAASGPSDSLPVGMAFDPSRQAVVLITAKLAGEGSPDPWGATQQWEWTGAVWRPMPETPVPIIPVQANLSTTSSGIVAFIEGAKDTGAGDTWSWSKGKWTKVGEAGPSNRSGHVMAYDSRRRRVVLFGGTKITDSMTRLRLGDTWEWDGKNWTQVH